jgi:hypothetical protein
LIKSYYDLDLLCKVYKKIFIKILRENEGAIKNFGGQQKNYADIFQKTIMQYITGTMKKID